MQDALLPLPPTLDQLLVIRRWRSSPSPASTNGSPRFAPRTNWGLPWGEEQH